LPGAAVGCKDRSPTSGHQDASTRREINYYCAALFLTRNPQQEARIIREMISAAERRGVILGPSVQDRSTEALYPPEYYLILNRPILVWVRFARLDPANSTLIPIAIVKFAPQAKDNVALLVPGRH
jgi:hypothetical protein